MIPFKILVIDVDGVLTDGTKFYTPTSVVGKSFFERDFTAMKQFITAGVKVICLTSDPMNAKLLAQKSKHICVVVTTVEKKLNRFLSLITQYNEVAYIGDDIEDVEILNLLQVYNGYPYVPISAHPELHTVFPGINREGGKGVIEKLYYEVTLNEK